MTKIHLAHEQHANAGVNSAIVVQNCESAEGGPGRPELRDNLVHSTITPAWCAKSVSFYEGLDQFDQNTCKF